MARVREAGTSLIPTASLVGTRLMPRATRVGMALIAPARRGHKLFFGGQFGDSLDLVFRQGLTFHDTTPQGCSFLVSFWKAWYSLIAPPKSSLISRNAEESLRNSVMGCQFSSPSTAMRIKVFLVILHTASLVRRRFRRLVISATDRPLVVNHQSQLGIAQEFLNFLPQSLSYSLGFSPSLSHLLVFGDKEQTCTGSILLPFGGTGPNKNPDNHAGVTEVRQHFLTGVLRLPFNVNLGRILCGPHRTCCLQLLLCSCREFSRLHLRLSSGQRQTAA